MKISYFLKKIQDVTFNDYLELLPMVCGFGISLFCKKKYCNTWLICEDPFEAHDNGYHFFKYLREKQPQIDVYYAIKKEAPEYKKVASLGKVIHYGSVKHWILYFNGKYNISSQKGGKPNAALCAFFELNHIFKPHNIFLQHGVIINDLEWLHADKTILDLFITSSVDEQRFIQDTFGFDKNIIVRTGLPRFDNLHTFSYNKNRIVIMPTWRKWLRLKSEKNTQLDMNFEVSEFIERWLSLLDSDELQQIIEKYNLEVIFYPHRQMQKHIRDFVCKNSKVIIASSDDYDIQDLLKSAKLLITDYSSVFFDMVYMKKPVIFYQFDEERFRKYHYAKGYFDYNDNPFGKAYNNHLDVIKALENYATVDFSVSQKFLDEHQRIFPYYDTNNSKRIYELLK